MLEDTNIFDVSQVKKALINDTLKEIYNSLEKRGYNALNQIVGYLISGDPGFISNYENARNKITTLDRTEIVAIILNDYLNK